MHAAHLCMLYLEEATEVGRSKAADLHERYPSAEHCAPPPPPPARVDCAGAWSPCLWSCADKTYDVWLQAAGGGAACEYAAGDTAKCEVGEGSCRAQQDCEGEWSGKSSSHRTLTSSSPHPRRILI